MLNMKTNSWGNKILNRLLVVVISFMVYVVRSSNRVQLFVTPWTAARQASLSLSNSRSLPKFMSITLVMSSSHLILWLPLLLLPSIFPRIRIFSNESAVCIRWPKYWSFSFSISPSNKYSGLISFKIDWSPCCPREFQESSPAPQFEGMNSLAFCLFYSPALTTVHDHWEDHSQDYKDLGQQSNVSAFQHTVYVCYRFPAKKQSSSDFMAAVTTCSDFRAKKRKAVTTLTFSPSICHEVMGPDAMILVILIFSFKLALSLSSLNLIKRLFSSFLLSVFRVVSSS